MVESGESRAWRKWARHLRTLLKKNYLLAKRNIAATAVQLLVPFILALLLYGLQYAIENSASHAALSAANPNPVPSELMDLQRCVVGIGRSACTTLAYSPNDDPVVDAIIDHIRIDTGLPADSFAGYPDNAAVNAFVAANPNTTQGAVHFLMRYSSTVKDVSNLLGVRFVLQYDTESHTVYGVKSKPVLELHLPMQKAVERAILKTVTIAPVPSVDVDFDYGYITMARPEVAPDDIVSTVGAIFFFGALMFNAVIQVSQIVMEKELHLTQTIKMMGVTDSAYWLSNLLWMMLMNLATVLMLIISGCIFQFRIFLLNDFGTYFFLFVLFAWSMIPIVFFISVLVKEAKTATVLGFALFLVGLIGQSFASTVYTEEVTWYRVIFSLLPFVVLSKGMSDLGSWSSSSESPGLRWANIGRSSQAYPLTVQYSWLIADFFIYFALTLYLSKVLPDSSGAHEVPWFCFKPSFWCPKRFRRATQRRALEDYSDAAAADAAEVKSAVNEVKSTEPATEEERVARLLDQAKVGADEAVLAEARRVEEYEADLERQRAAGGPVVEFAPVRFVQLGKIFFGRFCLCFPDRKKNFHAVRGLSLLLEKNRLFVLLGHNGAGKSTTFNMMTGLLQPTYGDGVVLGHSIIDGSGEMNQHIGVCPQHDVLWDQLTPVEHLQMFADFKDLAYDQVANEVAERLEDVALTKEGNRVAGNFSGGMKRRLSVAISLIGNPSVVYLDEPTTGMDPVSRRAVWDLIEKVKRTRVTVLTTHSMEEADVLGDRIGIMKKGKFITLGTSLALKNRFGSGYRISIVCEPLALPAASPGRKSPSPTGSPTTGQRALQQKRLDSQLSDVEAFVISEIATASVAQRSSNTTEIKVPNTAASQLPSMLAKLEERKATFGISDIQMNLTTLEEVFLKIGALDGGHDERAPTEEDLLLPQQKKSLWQRYRALGWKAWGYPLIAFVILVSLMTGPLIMLKRGTPPTAPAPTLLSASAAMLASSFSPGVWYQIPSDINATVGASCALGSPFAFFASRADSPLDMSHIALHFEAGSSCFSAQTCAATKHLQAFASNTSKAYKLATDRTGLLDHSNVDNPIKDFTHVYIPLCTADGHVGDSTHQYDAGLTIQHVGARNIQLVLQWLKAVFPASGVTDVAVIGGDFGAVGAVMWTSAVRQLFPTAAITLLVDSTQAVLGGLPPASQDTVAGSLLAWTAQAVSLWQVQTSPVMTALANDPSPLVRAAATLDANFTFNRVLLSYAQVNSSALSVAQLSSTSDPFLVSHLRSVVPSLRDSNFTELRAALCRLVVNTAGVFRAAAFQGYRDFVSSDATFSDLFVNNTLFTTPQALALVTNVVTLRPPTLASTDLSTINCA